MHQLLSQQYCGIGDDCWIDDHSNIFGILYYRDIFKSTQFLLTLILFQAHHNVVPLRLTDLESGQIYSEMNTSDCWWDTQNWFPAGAMFVPVMYASHNTHLTNISGDQHAWPLFLMLGNIRKDICRSPKQRVWIVVGLIPCPPQSTKNSDKAWHSMVRTVLALPHNLDSTGPGLNWDCGEGFQRKCNPR
jgi:hypothetical protein